MIDTSSSSTGSITERNNLFVLESISLFQEMAGAWEGVEPSSSGTDLQYSSSTEKARLLEVIGVVDTD